MPYLDHAATTPMLPEAVQAIELRVVGVAEVGLLAGGEEGNRVVVGRRLGPDRVAAAVGLAGIGAHGIPAGVGGVGLPGLEVDPARVEAVLSADDPVETGIAAAVQEANQLLRLPGVVGVNLSGLASARDVRTAAEIQAEIGHRIGAAQGASA